MIHYALGVISGILLTIAWLLYLILRKEKIERQIDEIEKKGLQVFSKNEVVILEPTTEAEEAVMQVISENEKKGRDTKVEEL